MSFSVTCEEKVSKQGWYWTKEWQKMEAEVDEEIKKGQLSPKFKTAEKGYCQASGFKEEIDSHQKCG
ncbi:MAG: hypothetical protein HWN68_03270 [Desulfobacterales bacterium]|nr:hypothetical protein [Desulfobacterales bacterium]